jgi:hypothetical protein
MRMAPSSVRDDLGRAGVVKRGRAIGGLGQKMVLLFRAIGFQRICLAAPRRLDNTDKGIAKRCRAYS